MSDAGRKYLDLNNLSFRELQKHITRCEALISTGEIAPDSLILSALKNILNERLELVNCKAA
jgi:hypothetical protein